MSPPGQAPIGASITLSSVHSRTQGLWGSAMMNMHRKISLRLDAELADRLQDRADRERVPVSYLLRHLVLRLLGEPQASGVAPSPAAPSPAWRHEQAASMKTRTEQLQAEFRNEVCSTFDDFVKQGCDPKEAAKRTNSALKAKNHPWASHEVVTGVLRKSGRFRKSRA